MQCSMSLMGTRSIRFGSARRVPSGVAQPNSCSTMYLGLDVY